MGSRPRGGGQQGHGPASPIWKTSDFVVVSLYPTTSPSLPHGAGPLGSCGEAGEYRFWMYFLCLLRSLANTSRNHQNIPLMPRLLTPQRDTSRSKDMVSRVGQGTGCLSSEDGELLCIHKPSYGLIHSPYKLHLGERYHGANTQGSQRADDRVYQHKCVHS